MASTIQIKNSNTAGNVPSSLTQGELAINVNDGNLFYGNGSSVKQDFAFTNITGSAISASGTITGNSLVGTVGTATQGTIDHDSLANFVANEHIDHSGVSITAGAGLTGGGTIASTRDIAVGAGTGVTVNADDVAIGQDVAITANVQFANITGSTISASGTIFTDTLSSPSNDLQIPSDTVTITAGTAGDANLILHADTDNNDENDNPYMYYKQDGDGGVFGIIGLSGANDKWPDGTTLTGATANGMVIGMTGSASGTARQVTIAAGNSASIVVKNDADVQMLESLIVDNNISASGDLISNTLDTKTNKLAVTSTVHGNHQGDVVFFGGTTSMDVGQIYNLNGFGGWTKAQANSQANSDALLAVALGAASDTNGMLLKGMVTLDHDPGTFGDPLYLSDGTAGQATSTAPNSTNDIVRLIGYCVDSTNGQIYFNPSNDFIKHA